MNLNPIFIKAKTLPDAWFQCLYNIATQGRSFIIDKGSFEGQTRIELDYTIIQIENPCERDVDGRPLVPVVPEGSNKIAPVDPNYVYDYWKYLMTPDKHENEQYTYGERIYDQIQIFIDTFKKYGHRNNQCVLQIRDRTDYNLEDPPCLTIIDLRVQDNKLHMFPYYRSWDLWGGFPANLAGISVLQEYMANEIGVETGEMICSSKGLHVYGYAEDFMNIWVNHSKGK